MFPLRALLHDETPNERFRLEVTAIEPEKIIEQEEKQFHPPVEYLETKSLPF